MDGVSEDEGVRDKGMKDERTKWKRLEDGWMV